MGVEGTLEKQVGKMVSGGREMKEVGRETRSRSSSIKGKKVGLDGKAEQGCEGKGAKPKNRLKGMEGVDVGSDKIAEVGKAQTESALGNEQSHDMEMGSHSHVKCTKDGCKQWIVSKDFNLNNFSNVEIKKMDIFCYSCLCEKNVKSEVKITGLEVELKEMEEERRKDRERIREIEGEKLKDREKLMAMDHEIVKLRQLIEVVTDPGRMNSVGLGQSQNNEQDYEREWPRVNQAQGNAKNHNERYSLKPRANKNESKETTNETNENSQFSERTDETVENIRGNGSEMRVQDTEISDGQAQGYPWQKVQRRKGKQEKKTPIIICGDSMVKEVGRNIKMKGEGSELCCYPGAQIKEVMERVKEKCRNGEDDLVVIQGGGNNLTGVGHRKTTEEVINTIKEITRGKKNRKVAMVGIIRRPRECINARYEEQRKKTNKAIQTEICRLKESKIQISFIDMDPIIQESMFKVDGVHLSIVGNNRMSTRILMWMKQKEIKISEGSIK